MAAEDFIITHKRKRYKFAKFADFTNCVEAVHWHDSEARKMLSISKRRIIEVGSGSGLFLVEQAINQPEAFFVAIDVKADRLYAGAKIALEQNVPNIVFLRAQADQLAELLDIKSVHELWLTFSDPYPKKRHAKHRMTHPRFLNIYRQLLKKGAVMHFKTDNHQLFDWSLEQLVSEGCRLQKLTYDLHASDFDNSYKIMTTYEARFVREGLPIYSVDAMFDTATL